MKNLTHNKIIKEILENVQDDMQDEEIIHLVLEKPIANNKQEKECAPTAKQFNNCIKFK